MPKQTSLQILEEVLTAQNTAQERAKILKLISETTHKYRVLLELDDYKTILSAMNAMCGDFEEKINAFNLSDEFTRSLLANALCTVHKQHTRLLNFIFANHKGRWVRINPCDPSLIYRLKTDKKRHKTNWKLIAEKNLDFKELSSRDVLVKIKNKNNEIIEIPPCRLRAIILE